MLNWIKENIILSFKVGLNNVKISVVLAPLIILSTVVTYLMFRNSLAQNGFWIIFVPMFLTLVAALVILIPKKNNPNYQVHHLFHLSTVSKIVILIAAILMIGLYLFAQCRDYGFSIGTSCFRQIFSR